MLVEPNSHQREIGASRHRDVAECPAVLVGRFSRKGERSLYCRGKWNQSGQALPKKLRVDSGDRQAFEPEQRSWLFSRVRGQLGPLERSENTGNCAGAESSKRLRPRSRSQSKER